MNWFNKMDSRLRGNDNNTNTGGGKPRPAMMELVIGTGHCPVRVTANTLHLQWTAYYPVSAKILINDHHKEKDFVRF